MLLMIDYVDGLCSGADVTPIKKQAAWDSPPDD